MKEEPLNESFVHNASIMVGEKNNIKTFKSTSPARGINPLVK